MTEFSWYNEGLFSYLTLQELEDLLKKVNGNVKVIEPRSFQHGPPARPAGPTGAAHRTPI